MAHVERLRPAPDEERGSEYPGAGLLGNAFEWPHGMDPSPPRLCILGSINMDLIVRVRALPAPGETVLGGGHAALPGGKGANQAVAAARMGARVAMIGRVGEDAHGRVLREVLAREGVETSRVLETPGAATGVALITVAEGGENMIAVAPGANALVSPEDAEAARAAILHADAILMSMESPIETIVRAAEIARESGTRVVLNAAPARALSPELLAAVDALVCNEGEAAIVPGEGSGPAAARFWSLPVGLLVMTQGAAGVCYRHEGRLAEVAPHRVEAIDTVGAGDAFAGTLAARVAEHQVGEGLDEVGVLDAICWANAAGALATTRAGAIPSLPTRAEVVRLLRESTLAG